MPSLGSLSPADRDRHLPAQGTTGKKLIQRHMDHDSSPHCWALASTNSASSQHQTPNPGGDPAEGWSAVPLEEAHVPGPGSCLGQEDIHSPGHARAAQGRGTGSTGSAPGLPARLCVCCLLPGLQPFATQQSSGVALLASQLLFNVQL